MGAVIGMSGSSGGTGSLGEGSAVAEPVEDEGSVSSGTGSNGGDVVAVPVCSERVAVTATSALHAAAVTETASSSAISGRLATWTTLGKGSGRLASASMVFDNSQPLLWNCHADLAAMRSGARHEISSDLDNSRWLLAGVRRDATFPHHTDELQGVCVDGNVRSERC
jgi:hypothetical protein